jgi:hypothetical protein
MFSARKYGFVCREFLLRIFRNNEKGAQFLPLLAFNALCQFRNEKIFSSDWLWPRLSPCLCSPLLRFQDCTFLR